MRFCPECGTGHECEAGTAGAPNPEVEIARINAERDVSVAKLAARQDADWNDTRVEVAEIEAEAGVQAAVAEAEVVGAAIEAGAVPPPEPPGPVMIDAPVIGDQEPAPDAVPPAEGSPPPEPKKKAAGLGMW
jgi:hypothetical protein